MLQDLKALEQLLAGGGDNPATALRKGRILRSDRLEAAKRAFTTRRVDFETAKRLRTDLRPHAGDLVLARVVQLGQHQKLETPHGRRAQLYDGDEIVVAFGERYAPDQFEAVVPESLDQCDLVAGGGVAGKVLSRHAKIRAATRIEPIGLLSDDAGNVLNLARFCLPNIAPSKQLPPVIAVVGTSMNAGKTTTAAGLIHGLSRAGMVVAATKVTGTGSGGDLWTMLDAGARSVLDFTDMGHASTAGLALDRAQSVAMALLGHCAAQQPDVIVMEVADGLLQRETSALLNSARLRDALHGVVFAAGDAMGALAGHDWLASAGHRILGVSGLLSASPLATREAEAALGRSILTLDQLRDAVTAPKICFGSGEVSCVA
ncbi:MAG: DUF1611 domain-containing protein [Pseudomonadota bacterium]